MSEKEYHNDNKAFIVYKDWKVMVDALDSDEERGKLFSALFVFSTTGEKPQLSGASNIAFIVMSQQIERDGVKWEQTCQKRRASANKRWGAKNANESNCISVPAIAGDTGTDTDTDTNIDTNTDKGTEKEIKKQSAPPPSPPRTKYGEYQNVLLSEEELTKLRDELGDQCDIFIQKLSSYMASSGKTYKNHFATIRKWYREDIENDTHKPAKQDPASARDTRSFMEVFDDENQP